MPRALITGITGQDGLYLSELLLAKGYEVYGLIRGQNNPKRELVERDRARASSCCTGDLTDLSSLIRALEPCRAGRGLQPRGDLVRRVLVGERPADQRGHRQRRAQHARGHPAVLRRRPEQGALLPGVVVGDVRQGAGGAADARARCSGRARPYGVAKVFGHYMTINYRESYGMHASSGILFNHESPRRGPEFVTRKIVDAPSRGSRSGCRTRSRWATSTPSVTGASPATTSTRCGGCCSSPRPTTTCVATGETHSIRELLDIAFARVGIDDWSQLVEQDPRFMRPGRGRPAHRRPDKARERLGWKPTVDFPELVTMMVDNDLAEQRASTGR